jgi:hypothetical protein
VRTLNVVFFTAVAVSIVHYTDNWLNFERYPTGGPGPEPTANTIWIAWVVFTALGVAAYLSYRSGRKMLGAGLLAAYSISGLVGLGHYTAAGMSELEWWRHAHIWADIACGAAVLAFAVTSGRRARRHAQTTRAAAAGTGGG